MEIIWSLTVRDLIWFALLLGPWVTLCLVLRQLRTNSMIERHKMYLSLHNCVTDDVLRTMKLHVSDYFDLQVYKQRYQGHKQRIISYLLMNRKYLYLYFSSTIKFLPNKTIARLWLKELCHYQELHDIHLRNRAYHKNFSELVEQISQEEGVVIDGKTPAPKGYMCDELSEKPEVKAESRSEEDAMPSRPCAAAEQTSMSEPGV